MKNTSTKKSGRTLLFVLICCLAGGSLYAQPSAPTVTGAASICAGGTTTLVAAGQAGASFQWWDAPAGGNLKSSSASYTIPIQNTAGIYQWYVQQTAGGQTSSRTPVSVTVNAVPGVSLSGSLCNGGTLLLNTSPVPAQIQWQSNNTVVRTDNAVRNTNATTVAGGTAGSGLSQLGNNAQGVFVDLAGNIYIADADNNRIVKWAPGASSGVVVAGGNGGGAAANQLSGPSGVYVDAAQNVYVADFLNMRVQKWAPGATSGSTVAGTGSSGAAANQLRNPMNITMDAYGNLYVADLNNHRIQKWAPGATQGVTVAGMSNGTSGSGTNALNQPTCVRVDSAGNVYVVESLNDRVTKWAPGSSNGIVVAGGNGSGSFDIQLSSPHDMVIDRMGNLYIADEYNHRVQLWAAGETWGTTVAGTGTYGTANNQLNRPAGIALDAAGNLYVTDLNNNRVQKFAQSNNNLTSPATVTGSFAATVTSFAGCMATTPVSTIVPWATISAGPSGNTLCSGASFTLSVTAANVTGYQWQQNGTNLPGATTATYTKGNSVVGDAGTYRVIAVGTSGCNDTSADAALNVNPVPVVSLSGSSCSGDSLLLITSSTPAQIQWKWNSTIVQTDTAWRGNAVTVAGGTGGSGLTQLNGPNHTFIDAAGNVYVADRNNNRVVKWAPGATSGVVVAGGNGAGSAANQLNAPMGVYVDAAQNVYVAEYNNDRVQRWTPGAASGTTVAGGNGSGSGANQLNSPVDVTMDASGNLYITDEFNSRIQKWAPGATSGTTVAGALSFPRAAKVDAAGNVYVADLGNSWVIKWAPGSSNGVVIASGSFSPEDLAIDGAGNLYVADGNNNGRILSWAPGTSTPATVAGIGGTGNGANQLSAPSGIALDAAGNLYVTDQLNNRVQKFIRNNGNLRSPLTVPGSYTATVTSFAGCTATTSAKTISQQATIGTEPVSTVICSGNPFALSVAATNATGYQWQKNGTNISATAAVFSNNNSAVADAGNYRVIVTGAGGCNDTSANTVLKVNTTPVVSLSGTSSCSGDTLMLTALSIPAQVQWKSGSAVQRTDGATWKANAVTVAGGSGGSGLTQFLSSRGVFADGAGNVYIADMDNQRVVKWAPGATQGVVVAGGNGLGTGANQLYEPSGIFVDAAQNVYVADAFNHRVQKWAPGAAQGVTVAGITGSGGQAANQLYYPVNVTMDIYGNLYVSDYSNHRIQKWAPGATQGVTVAGMSNGSFGTGTNALTLPAAAKIDTAGNVYVLDGNNRVTRWAPGSSNGVVVASGLPGPTDMDMDGAGNMYFVDQSNHRIMRWAQGAGSGTTVAGTGTSGNGASQLNSPYGIMLDTAGNMYVTDQGNYRVQKFTLNSNTPLSPPTVAGNYTAVITSFAGCTATTPARAIGQRAKISTQPVAGSTICSNSPVAFNVTAANASGYQWQKNGLNISATAATFSLAGAAASDAGIYRVIAVGTGGCNDTSANAILNVHPAPVISLAGSPCSGDTLNLTASFVPAQIQWKSGSTILRTDTAAWNTNAGTVAGGSSGSGLAQLNNPRRAFVDAAGNVYVADQGNHRVVKWVPGATQGIIVAGSNSGPLGGSGPDQLYQPFGVYVDAAQNVYIADFGNHRIQKWAPGANSGITVAGGNGSGNAASQLNNPINVTMDATGNLYISDRGNNRIQKWAPGATQGITVAGMSNGNGGSGTNALSLPGAAKVDSAGNIYVAEYGNGRISKWAPGGSSGVIIASNVGTANDLEIDAMGNVYIADQNSHTVLRWSPGVSAATIVAGTGSIGNDPDQFAYPYGVSLDPAGNLYVTDWGNNRVQKFALNNNFLFSPSAAAGSYTVIATSLSGCAAATPVKTINQRATLTTEPAAGKMVCTTNPIVLTAAAINTTGYQWQQNGTDIPAATAAILNKSNSVTGDAGTYRVIAIGAGGCNDTSTASTISVSAMSNSLPSVNTTAGNLHIDGLDYCYTDSSCRPIAGIADAAGGNVLGNVHASVVFDSTVRTFNGTPYVQRHFDLQPSGNGAATVRLYALQSEFDAYNAYITAHSLYIPKLPAGPSDTAGRADINVTQFHGVPASGTTGPGGQYDASLAELISGNRITTAWNGSYWTLSFPVSGFSGFFISTGNIVPPPLAIGLTDISARNSGSNNIVDWNTATESEGDYFEVERSLDAKQFSKIGVIAARYKTGGSYRFTDEQPASGINYYRLKMMDAAGNSSYSKVVSAIVKGAGMVVEAFPNPAKDAVTVRTNAAPDAAAAVMLLDISGKTIFSVPFTGTQVTLNIHGLATGFYLLRYQSAAYSQNMRFTKE